MNLQKILRTFIHEKSIKISFLKTITTLLSSLHPEEINIKDQLDKYVCLLVFASKIADQTHEIKNKLRKLMQSRTSQQTGSVLQQLFC